jgi:hypothetical protein
VESVWQGKPKYSEETCPGATLSTTKFHMTTRSRTPDGSGGKPANNRLSYGAASVYGFFYLVRLDLTPFGPFASPLGSYKSQYCGHTLAYCTFSPDDI